MAAPDRVRRRHVLYLAGFDPQGPGQYHALYEREAPQQAAVSGYDIEVGPRQRASAHTAGWDVSWRREGETEVQTRYELLRWDDIVRRYWPTGRWTAIQLTAMNSWQMTRNGCFWRFLHISWPAVLALALPALLLMGVLLVAGLLLAVTGVVAWRGHALPALVGALCAGLGLFAFTRWAEAKLYMGWLMRSTRVILRQARGELPELERRLDDFAERVVALSRNDGIDELLVVGHSSGAMLAASVVARALEREPALGRSGTRVALVTLGHCMPLLSCQPEAQEFRAELLALRRRGHLPWIDFTAPADGCCSALTDPTALHASEADDAEARRVGGEAFAGGPKLLSPRFNKIFSAARYADVRRDKYRCHFQYLMASELPGDYDYFAMTAGPLRLADRFAHLASVTDFRDFQLFGGPGR